MTEELIRFYINKAINKYNIEKVTINNIEEKSGFENSSYFIVTLFGGLNGNGRFSNYLEDVKHIVDQFRDVWLIDWKNDCLDDCWCLRLGIEL